MEFNQRQETLEITQPHVPITNRLIHFIEDREEHKGMPVVPNIPLSKFTDAYALFQEGDGMACISNVLAPEIISITIGDNKTEISS